MLKFLKLLPLIIMTLGIANCGVPNQDAANSEAESTSQLESSNSQNNEFIFATKKIKPSSDIPEERPVTVKIRNKKTGEEFIVDEYHIVQTSRDDAIAMYGTIELASELEKNKDLQIVVQDEDKTLLKTSVQLSLTE